MPRTRTRTTDQNKYVTLQGSNNGGASWTNAGTINMKSSDVDADLMSDEVTPSFKVRQANGEIIMNPCESWSSDLTRYGAYGYYLRKRRKSDQVIVQQIAYRHVGGQTTSETRYPRLCIADMGGPDRSYEMLAFGLTPSLMVNLEQRALAAALEKATSSDALGLVTLAELDKTVDLLKSCGKSVIGMASLLESLGPQRLRELNRNLRRIGRLSKKQGIKLFLRTLDRGARNIASTWLGYRYGVMATVYDVESWVEAFQLKNKRSRVVATVTDNWESIPAWNVTPNWHASSGYPGTGPFQERIERRRRSVVRAGVIMGMEAMGTGERLGFNRIASSAWELIPFTFVLDWLFDTGTRLAALEGSTLHRPLGTWVTHEHTLSYQHPWRWTPAQGSDATYTYESGGADEGNSIESCMYRKRVANPQLSFVPQAAVKLNWKRITDAVALVGTGSSRIRNAAIAKL